MFGPGAVLDSFQSSGAAPKLLRGAITYVAGTTGAIATTTLFTVMGASDFLPCKGKYRVDLRWASNRRHRGHRQHGVFLDWHDQRHYLDDRKMARE